MRQLVLIVYKQLQSDNLALQHRLPQPEAAAAAAASLSLHISKATSGWYNTGGDCRMHDI